MGVKSLRFEGDAVAKENADRAGDSGAGLHAVVPAREVRRALEQDELVLHYQAQVALDGGAPRGAEALLRWQHPHRGLLPPDDFLPAVAHTAVMPLITAWVLDSACRTAVTWPEGTVAVNVSAADLLSGQFPKTVLDALEASGLAAERLTIEITEHALVHDLERATANLRQLTDVGVRASLDDFGTGYSSMLYLRSLPIHELKIDRVFVAGLGHHVHDEAIVTSLIALGHAVGLEVVAEGVETALQAQLLTRQGADLAQGYLYGKPQSDYVPAAVSIPSLREQSTARRPKAAALATPEFKRSIGALLTDGASLHTIAAMLNQRGSRTAQGNRWVASTVARAIAEISDENRPARG